MIDDGIENRQQLVHAGHQCHFRCLASGAQVLYVLALAHFMR